MTRKHWAWITAGLLCWTALVVLWATGPSHCQPPDRHHKVRCLG